MTPFADYQTELYLDNCNVRGLALPADLIDLENVARRKLRREVFGFISGGASLGRTVSANLESFTRYRLVPRLWQGATDVSARQLGVTVLGTELAAPVLTAPIGALEMLSDNGDLAVAETTRDLGVGAILSTVSSATIEEFGAVADRWWYQLYWPADDDVARSLVRRADNAGARAIVVTADNPRMGWRPQELKFALHPFLRGKGVANYLSDPVFRSRLSSPPETGPESYQEAIRAGASMFGNHHLGPHDICRLRNWTDLPIAIKGVQHPADALAMVDAGADAIVVSNHGGRQVDGAIGSLDALAPIVEAVGDRAEVIFDSGIRSGADIIIAMALGAKAVFCGRPWAYGLGLAGADGVQHVLRCLLADLDITLGLIGVASLDHIGQSFVQRTLPPPTL